MRVRLGFVSNSSSSSFVCMISGEVESGMDMTLSEAGMVMCEHHHVFLERYLLGDKDDPTVESIKQWLKDNGWDKYYQKEMYFNDKEFLEWFEDCLRDEWDNEVSSSQCPICSLEEITDKDIARYFFKKNEIERRAFIKEIKNEFGDYVKFDNFLKST